MTHTTTGADNKTQQDTPKVSRTLPDIEHNNGGIYAILDTKAQAIIGFLMICRHEAQAIRNFCDVADDPQSMIHRHPQDYELVRLGWLTTDNLIIAQFDLILAGNTYQATQKPNE